MIGGYLARTAAQSGRSARALTRSSLDILDFAAVRRLFRRDKPQWIIHCAALSQSPACQQNPQLARLLNIGATRMLAEFASDMPFVFFSTDLVFDGLKGNYRETDPVHPLSVYAETKAQAEEFVLANPRHTVIRTSLNGGTSLSGDRGFNEQLRRAFERGAALTLFTDEFRCPIPAEITAQATWELLGQPGLFHVAGAERLSRWEIGQLLATRWPQLRPVIKPESLSSYEGSPRSPDTSLDCSKAQALLSFQLPGLTEWLAHREPGDF